MGTLNEDLVAIKAVEDTIIANKVAKFAYTDEAYTNNDANGVTAYNVNNAQNIPTADASILKVNETILNKGWRAQASSITRMLMNHFLGRLSYNLNKVNDNVSNLITTLLSHRGTADGFATLDSNGRIPASQLPETALEYKGTWDASTNTPTLANGTGTKGDLYICSVGGAVDFGSGTAIAFLPNDRVVYNGTVWEKLSGGEVRTVGGVAPDSATGNVPLSVNGVSPDNTGNIQLELDWSNAYYIVCFIFNNNGGYILSAGNITIPADGEFVPIAIGNHAVSSSQELKTYLDAIFASNGITIKQYINASSIDQSGVTFNTTQNKVAVIGGVTAPEPAVYLRDANGVDVINLSVTSYPLGTDINSYKLEKSSVELRKRVFKQGTTLTPRVVAGNQGIDDFCGGLLFVPYKK